MYMKKYNYTECINVEDWISMAAKPMQTWGTKLDPLKTE